MDEKTMDNRKNIKTAIVVIFCAIFARVLGKNGFPDGLMGFTRTLLYISLYMGWGIFNRKRVIQPQVRRYLSAVSALIIFWFLVRSCKYYFAIDLNMERHLWYSYYVSMLFIPLFAVFVALSLGKPEGFRLGGWTRILYIPTVLLVLLVLSNDLHQWVFSFPADEIWTDVNNSVEWGYFVVLGWEVLCAALAITIILMKNRQTQQGRRLPVVILICSVIYALIYISGVEWMQVIAGDIAAAQCLFYVGIIESCFQTGLISTNTGYDTLFQSVSTGIQITDKNYRVCYFSEAAEPLSKETMMEADRNGILWNGTTLIKAYAINGGHAIWQEDISDLLRVKEELRSAKEELKERNEILRDQYRKDAERYRLEEQNRLYDLAQRETQKQLKEIDILSDQFARAERGSSDRKKMLLRILMLGTYIKRHKDMVISSDRSRTATVNLLESALRESLSNLSLAGISGNVYIPCSEELLTMPAALEAYDLFEDAMELSLDTLEYYFITVSKNDDGILCLHMNMECRVSLASLGEKHPHAVVEQDEDSWFLTEALTMGGDSV